VAQATSSAVAATTSISVAFAWQGERTRNTGSLPHSMLTRVCGRQTADG
jgi:hypothetical protein